MTTFGLPADTISSSGGDVHSLPSDASNLIPIDIISPSEDNIHASDDCGSANYLTEDPEELIREAARQLDELPLVPTQPQTQSQGRSYDPDRDQHLVGLLIPSTDTCEHFELSKDKRSWTIGRHKTNDFVLDGLKLSNFHCTIQWNGLQGKHSEVVLVDSSTNGSWVNNAPFKGSSVILRGGAAISLGGAPDQPGNQCRFIFRDIEGQSAAHMKQVWAKYDIGHELGFGAFARVHKCIERATGEEFAVKIIDRAKLRRSQSDEAVTREISILRRLAEFRHKHIVSLREYFEEPDSIYIILELVKGGDLLSYIGIHGAIREQLVRRMAAQMCHAVAYIHSQGIAHRDLKPENVMITATSPPDCKVADFGLAKLVGSGTFLKTMCGTPAYLAPEVVLRSPSQAYDNKVDSWSLGVIFFCMLTGQAPFPELYDNNATQAEKERYYYGRQIRWEALDTVQLSGEGRDFLRCMLAFDPRDRSSVVSMLYHHWIATFVPTESQYLSSEPLFTSTTPTTEGEAEACKSMENLNLSDMSIPGLSLTRAGREMPGAYPESQDVGSKRKNIIDGSSPLSSLSPSEDERELPDQVGRRQVVRKPPSSSKRKKTAKVLPSPRRSGRRQPKAARHS